MTAKAGVPLLALARSFDLSELIPSQFMNREFLAGFRLLE